MSLPWLEAMGSFGEGAPTRLIYVYAPNGIIPGGWMPVDAEGTPAGQARPLGELPALLAPLQSHAASLQVLSGLTHDKGRANGDGPGDHARASATFLTGVQPLKSDGAVGLGVSADQVAAAALGQRTRFRSIQLGTDGGQLSGQCDSGYSCAYSGFISWQSATTPAGKESDPARVFDRLFRGGLAPGVHAARLRPQAQRRSILAFVREDAPGLRRLLGHPHLPPLHASERGLPAWERRRVDVADQSQRQPLRPRQGDHRRIVGAVGHRRRQEVEAVFRRRLLQHAPLHLLDELQHLRPRRRPLVHDEVPMLRADHGVPHPQPPEPEVSHQLPRAAAIALFLIRVLPDAPRAALSDGLRRALRAQVLVRLLLQERLVVRLES